MGHFIRHNQVDALQIDQLFLESKLLQSTIRQGRQLLPDFSNFGQDVFFALYKIYLEGRPDQVSDDYRLLLTPLLESPTLDKLRRRSVSSLSDSFVALKLLLDFFLEQTRGRDILAQTKQMAESGLNSLKQQLSEREYELMSTILSLQDKALNAANLEHLLQELYDFATDRPSSDSVTPSSRTPDAPQDEEGQSLFEEALHAAKESLENLEGDQAVKDRLDQTELRDQTFQGGLETEMDDRFSSFLKKQFLTQGDQMGAESMMMPLPDDGDVDEKRIGSGSDSEEIIAAEAFSLTKEQEQLVANQKRTGLHRELPQKLRDLDQWDMITNPAASIPWDQALEDVTKQLDRFDKSLDELGINKATLQQENFDQVIDIYRRLTSPQFLKLLDRIGRNKRYARKVQYQKRSRLAFPIDKIASSNRIDQMIDDEYISLALDIDAFEKDFYERYLHDSLLTTKMINRSDKHRGPIIVCYDGSGSMNGQKILDTQTHILTILEVARIQKRHLIIIQFASQAEPLFIRELNPLEISARDVYDVLDTFLSGGTDFELPLKKALEYIRRDRHRQSDILFFTDGLAAISSRFKQQFTEQKKRYRFKLFTVIMHSLTYEDYGDIGEISDEILTIEEKDLGQNHDVSYQRIYNAI